MLRDPKVIEYLNTQLTNELTAINQYFLHARILRHWGVTKLGKHEYDESIEEMHHADWLIERILFLDGLPNVQRLNQVMIGQTVAEILGPECPTDLSAAFGSIAGSSSPDALIQQLMLRLWRKERAK